MRKHYVLVSFGLLLGMAGLYAESGSMGYGAETKKPMTQSQEMGMEQASVKISAPSNGAMLLANQPVKISYQVTTGQKGDHIHLYVDGERVAVIKQLAGDYELKKLNPGKHKISIEIVTKDHQHIGVGQEITVEAR